MARDWETWLHNSTGPASATEEQDRDRTEQRIKKAIAADSRLAGNVRVFVKGSYATGTNVRRDSDVDIAVEWKSWSYISKPLADEYSWDQLGVPVGNQGPTPTEYRSWVEAALFAAFGYGAVSPGNKAITVAGGSGTLDADVVPCFRHRRYDSPGVSHTGIRLYPRNGGKVENWPEQNRVNGIAKNSATSRYFKQMVRAFKRLENDMLGVGLIHNAVPGFTVESMLWNCPDSYFLKPTYKETTEALLLWLWGRLRDGSCTDWAEVNNLKYLLRGLDADKKKDEAFTFVDRAYDYIFRALIDDAAATSPLHHRRSHDRCAARRDPYSRGAAQQRC